MNYVLLTIAVLLTAQIQAQDSAPLIGEIEARGWTVLADEQGDLDGDEQDERVLVLDTGEKTAAGITRQLYVFQWVVITDERGKETNDWQVWQESATAVLPGKEDKEEEEADVFAGLNLEDGVLTLNHQGEDESSAWTYAHQYLLSDGALKLTELETINHISCEKRVIFAFNLRSGLASCTREDESCGGSGAANNSGTARMDFMKKAEALPALEAYVPGTEEMTVMGLNEVVKY